jgi:hypothetical protein
MFNSKIFRDIRKEDNYRHHRMFPKNRFHAESDQWPETCLASSVIFSSFHDDILTFGLKSLIIFRLHILTINIIRHCWDSVRGRTCVFIALVG